MAKIIAKMESFANDEELLEIVNAVNANTPANIEPQAATIVRDSNGKLVEVHVGLPADIAASDLNNAKNAVQNNNGVSKSRSFPKSSTSGLETQGFTDYQDLTGTDIDLGEIIASVGAYNAKSKIEATSAAEALYGSRSLAYKMVDSASLETKNEMISFLKFTANKNGLNSIEGWKCAFKLKLAPTYNSVASDIGSTALEQFRVLNIFGGVLQTLNGEDWTISLGNTLVDTGIAFDAEVHMSLEMSPSGVITFKELNSGSEIIIDQGYASARSNVEFTVTSVEYYALAADREVQPMIVDDITIDILSGS